MINWFGFRNPNRSLRFGSVRFCLTVCAGNFVFLWVRFALSGVVFDLCDRKRGFKKSVCVSCG